MIHFSQIKSLITIRYQKTTFIVVVLMYVAGIIGLIFPSTQPYFKLASAFNLWVSLILLLLFHQDYDKPFIVTMIGIFLAGFFVEVVGVYTGMIFGIYWYGQTLGTKILGVPIVIGANWLLLVYCSNQLTHVLSQFIKRQISEDSIFDYTIVKAIFASFLMVCLDFLIEPVAIHLDFWHWQFGKIPAQNFQAWFLIAVPLSYIFLKFGFRKSNPLAVLLFILQFLFFVSINIFNAVFI